VTRGTFPFIFTIVCVSTQASAQTDSNVTIQVDATASGTPLRQVWSYFGYDEANYTTTEEAQELLRTLAASHTDPVRVRTHFLFNTGDGEASLKWGSTNLYTEDDSESPIYDFSLIDGIMDAQIASGVVPLFEIGFMPEALSVQPSPYQNSGPHALDGGSHYPPKDYEKWAALVATYAEHVKERYPGAEETWQWELWNEPDIAYFQGTFEEYARLYDFTEAALHEVLPLAPLGGPAIARPTEDFFAQFLEHCARGQNAVTGETGTRLDLVSFHAKGGTRLLDLKVLMDLGNQLKLHQEGFKVVAASEFSETPIVISEADPDGCAACSSNTAHHLNYRNSPAYGAYEVAMMKRSLELADEAGVNLQGVLTWAFTFPGSDYFPGYRALATNGIALPVLNAFKLLGRLSGNRLPATSSGALPLGQLLEQGVRGQPDVDAMATRNKEDVQVLVWNYHDHLVEAEPASVTLKIQVPAAFSLGAMVTHRRVDETHGNAFAVFETLGSPQTPTAEQHSQLLQAANSIEFHAPKLVEVKANALVLSFDLPRFGVSLVTLKPATVDDLSSSPVTKGGGCACQLALAQSPPLPAAPIILLVLPILRRIRPTERVGTPTTTH